MATSSKETLNNAKYRNWIKSGLGLKYVKEGVQQFVTDIIKHQHGKFVAGLRQCSSCSLETLLPFHAVGVGSTCSLGRKRCLCIGNKRTIRTRCPLNVCGKMYDQIVKSFFSGDPNFSNTDITKWVTEPWELGKCYINAWGYKDKTSAEDTDCLGLLSIIINNMECHAHIDVQIGTTNDIVSKVRQYRNDVMHSSDLEVTDANLKTYIEAMDAVLDDPKQLRSDKYAQLARKKLKQLLETDIYISTEDEISIIRKAQRSLERNCNIQTDIQAESLQEIFQNLDNTKEMNQNRFESIEKTQDSLRKAIDDLNNKMPDQQMLMSDIQQIKTDLESVEAEAKVNHDQIVVLAECIKKVETVQQAMILEKTQEVKDRRHKEQIEYLRKKMVLKEKVIEMYERHLSTVPISPILEEMRSHIGEVWVDMNIYDYSFNQQEKLENVKSADIELKSYKDIFFKNGTRCLNMYMLGDAGMGKTTWCIKLVNDWVKGLKEPLNHADLKELISYEIVILIFLRLATQEVKILDMIKEQLFSEDEELHGIFTEVLKKEPNKCLVIVDGLDDWTRPINQGSKSLIQNQGIPSKAGLKGCPLLITSRPSKLYEIGLKSTEFDRCMKINGVKDKNELAKRIITKLKKPDDAQLNKLPSDDDKTFADFENATKECYSEFVNVLGNSIYSVYVGRSYFKRYRMSECMENPLLLIISVCLWFQYGKLEKTLAGNYSQMFRYLIEYTLNMRKYKIPTPYEESSVADKSNLLPECLNGIVPKQYNTLMIKLAEFAFDSLFHDSEKNKSHIVFSEEALKEWFTDYDLQAAVNCGILSKECAINQPLTRMTRISFLHKSFQEYFAAVHIVGQFQNYDDSNMEPLEVYQKYCFSKEKIEEMENVILFVCGLDPRVASEISLHVQNVARKTNARAFDYLTYILPLHCTIQVHKFRKEYPSPQYPIHFEILLLYEKTERYSHNMDYIYNMLMSNINNLKQIHIKSNHVVKNVLNCQLPLCLTICVLQNLDLSGFSSEQLITFGKSLEKITNLKLVKLTDIKLSYPFSLHLQNCQELKTVKLYGIDLIEIKVNAQKIENIKIHNCSIDLFIEGDFMLDIPLNQIQKLVRLLSNTNMTAKNASVESGSQIIDERAERIHFVKSCSLSLKYDTTLKKCFAKIKHGNIPRNNLEHFLEVLKDNSYFEIQGLDIILSDGNDNTFSDRKLNIQTKVLSDLFKVFEVSGFVLNNSQDLDNQDLFFENENTIISQRKLKKELTEVITDVLGTCDHICVEREIKEMIYVNKILNSLNSEEFPIIFTSSHKSGFLIISNATALETEFLVKKASETDRITHVHVSLEKLDHDLVMNLLKSTNLQKIEIKLSQDQLQLADILDCELHQNRHLMLQDNRIRFSLEPKTLICNGTLKCPGTLICSGTNVQETENIVRFVTKIPGITTLKIATKTINSDILLNLIACEHLCKIELMLSCIVLSETEEKEIETNLRLYSKGVEFDKKLHSIFDDVRIACQIIFGKKPLLQRIHSTSEPVHLSIYGGWRVSSGNSLENACSIISSTLHVPNVVQKCITWYLDRHKTQ